MSTVSVVVPTYNRAELLRETIHSILAQTRPADEIIVVDDGSTDHTADVCREFPAPVRYVWQENRRLSGARNRGIHEATSEWIAFCDSDDLWHPRKLEIQLDALAAVPDALWAVTACDVIGPGGEPVTTPASGVERVFPVFTLRQVTPEQHFGKYLTPLLLPAGAGRAAIRCYHGDAYELLFYGNVVLPSSAIVHRTLLERTGGFDEAFTCAEETEYFHRAAAASDVVVVLEPLVSYRMGHSSIVSGGGSTIRLTENALESLERAARLRQPLSPGARAAFRWGRDALSWRLAYARLTNMDRRGARAALLAAWRESGRLQPRQVGLAIATLTPASVLRLLARLKRLGRG
jgi:GT2 family glycosyltransferase